MDNIVAVADLIIRMGRVVGRKRLQKIVYVLQYMGFPFKEDFEYGHYGPYSRELADEIDVLNRNGLVSEHASPNAWGTEYIYQPTELLSHQLTDVSDTHQVNGRSIDDVLRDLQQESTSVLEVASSRLFLKSLGYTNGDLDTALGSWKPHLRSYFDHAHALLQTLGLDD